MLSNPSSDTSVFANRNVFEGCEDEYPYIRSETKSLFVRGVKLEHIVSVSNAPGKETWFNGETLDFVQDFISRHPLYVSGVTPLQAFYRLVNRDSTFSINHSIIGYFLAFLEVLSALDKDPKPPNLTIRKILKLAPGNFDQQIIQKLFPEVDPKQYEFQESLESSLEQYASPSLEEFEWKIYLNLTTVAS
jgi:hypothetical protein